jgi:6-pyruvoyltetrahydropterin/6-carboxytetrahydropterin synthase
VTERFELHRSFGFEAAHHLPNTPDGHRCRHMHGHSYEVELHVTGELDEEAGWVMDFADIDTAFSPVRERLDHRLLNDVDGLENPTSEVLARWVWQQLAATLPGLTAVIVRETPRSECSYRGPT